MLSVQDVGKNILTGIPSKFYIFCGTDYGIKCRYLDKIISYYGGKYKICETANSVFSTMNKKHLLPLEPMAYIIKYDTEFLSTLDAKSANKIESCNIVGTIVLFYEESKHCQKCDKYLPNYSIDFVATNSKFICKYLSQDYSNFISDKTLQNIVAICGDYNKAETICKTLKLLYKDSSIEIDIKSLYKMYYSPSDLDNSELRKAIIHRDFSKCMNIVEYLPDFSQVYHIILSTMMTLEKTPSGKWDIPNIYNMFNQTYNQLKLSRKYTFDIYNSVVYLLSLLRFDNIPSIEVLS